MKKASIRPVGVGVVSDQMLDRSALVRSEYYNDFMGKIDCEAGVGVTIVREDGRSFMLSTTTSRVDPDDNRPAANLLTTLAPHLRRAFHLRHDKSMPEANSGEVLQVSRCGSVTLRDDTANAILR